MTNKTEAELLDEARYAEAIRLSPNTTWGDRLEAYRQLVRDNWQPVDPDDPDLIEARKMLAAMWPAHDKDVLLGRYDESETMPDMRLLIRAGYRQVTPKMVVRWEELLILMVPHLHNAAVHLNTLAPLFEEPKP